MNDNGNFRLFVKSINAWKESGPITHRSYFSIRTDSFYYTLTISYFPVIRIIWSFYILSTKTGWNLTMFYVPNQVFHQSMQFTRLVWLSQWIQSGISETQKLRVQNIMNWFLYPCIFWKRKSRYNQTKESRTSTSVNEKRKRKHLFFHPQLNHH